MNIYHYDVNGQLAYQSEATYDALDGSVNVPANSTTLTPLGAVSPDIDRFDITNNCWTIVKYVAPSVPPIIPPTPAQLAQLQSNAIDNYIAQQIEALGYDNIGEVAVCCLPGKWQAQAVIVNDWIQQCWVLQSNIISESVVYADIPTAIAALPVFSAS